MAPCQSAVILAILLLCCASGPSATSAACTRGDQCPPETYCASTGACAPFSHKPIATPPPPPLPHDANARLLITASLQFYHTACAHAGQSTCIFDAVLPELDDPAVSTVVLDDAAERQAACMSSLSRSADSTLTLGDLTNLASQAQLDSLSAFYLQRVRNLAKPSLIALGASDVVLHAGRSVVLTEFVRWAKRALLQLQISHLDLRVAAVDDALLNAEVVSHAGSLSYMRRVGVFDVLVLSGVRDARGTLVSTDGSTRFDIHSPARWLRDRLGEARQLQRGVIIMPYDLHDLTAVVQADDQLMGEVASGVVKSVVCASGPVADEVWNIGGKSIPAVQAGSASYDTLLSLHLGSDASVRPVLINVEDGANCRPFS